MGRRLTLTPGTFDPADADVTYTWLRNGKPVAGVTGRTYDLAVADVGRQISVQVNLRHTGYRNRTLTMAADGVVTTVPSLRVVATGRPGRAVVARTGDRARCRLAGRSRHREDREARGRRPRRRRIPPGRGRRAARRDAQRAGDLRRDQRHPPRQDDDHGQDPAPLARSSTEILAARDESPARAGLPLRVATRAWFLVSLQTFGGPAGQIAVMQRTLVDERRWIGEKRFLHALNYCMLLPGPGGPAARDLHRMAAQRLARRADRRRAVRDPRRGRHARPVVGCTSSHGDTTLVTGLFLGLAPAVRGHRRAGRGPDRGRRSAQPSARRAGGGGLPRAGAARRCRSRSSSSAPEPSAGSCGGGGRAVAVTERPIRRGRGAAADPRRRAAPAPRRRRGAT